MKDPQTLQQGIPSESIISLVLPPHRMPTSPAEAAIVKLLEQKGPSAFFDVVDQVAHKFYRDEIRNGAWALDLGLLGPGLFVRQVLRDLEAGTGVLWQIEVLEQKDELLPGLS